MRRQNGLSSRGGASGVTPSPLRAPHPRPIDNAGRRPHWAGMGEIIREVFWAGISIFAESAPARSLPPCGTLRVRAGERGKKPGGGLHLSPSLVPPRKGEGNPRRLRQVGEVQALGRFGRFGRFGGDAPCIFSLQLLKGAEKLRLVLRPGVKILVVAWRQLGAVLLHGSAPPPSLRQKQHALQAALPPHHAAASAAACVAARERSMKRTAWMEIS